MRSSPFLSLAGTLLSGLGLAASVSAEPIDRRALVERHFPRVRSVDPRSPLSVGNGHFAFTADVTGLQSLADTYYAEGIPTETLARWAWHSEPNPKGYTLLDASTPFDSPRGPLLLPTKASSPAGEWLRRNPHLLALAEIRLETKGAQGSLFRRLVREDVRGIDQTLDLWNGVLESRYSLAGRPVRVTTAVHPTADSVSFRIDSPLLAEGRLRVVVAFPRGHRLDIKNTPPLDWSEPDSHTTREVGRAATRLDLERTRDATRLFVSVVTDGGGRVERRGEAPHEVVATHNDKGALELTVAFSPQALSAVPAVDETLAASRIHWPAFWMRGGAVDFTGSRDPRATELERRVVLSQYLTAIQSAASVPPQETGLTCSTWYGKHHTEMLAWHTAHFALWGRSDLLAKNLEWYREQLPMARLLATERGLTGARWPKMTGPEGRESPGGNPLIVWNQPHPVWLAELVYRSTPSAETLARYGALVEETAEALSSMVHLDASGRYALGPPLWIAQEIYDPATSQNPSFELAYWAWALDTAQRWRERAAKPRRADWDDIVARLTPLPVADGLYVALGSHPDTFRDLASRHDHPTMLAPFGLLPGWGVDRETMRRTLEAVLTRWDFEAKIWGWDYPMIAMTAARLGETGKAVDALLLDGPNNAYLPNGHCPQRSDMVRKPGGGPGRNEIAVYLPANGALLAAVAMMAGGWDGAPAGVLAPGFPKDGTWTVRAEGLALLP